MSLSEEEIEEGNINCANDTMNNYSIEKFSYELKGIN